MRVACLILCHKDIPQINQLLKALEHPDVYTFIHADRKMGDVKAVNVSEHAILLPDEYRVDVQWACYSVVRATLNLIRYAKNYGDFDYYCLLSGQDFPVMPMNRFVEYLAMNKGNDFINLFESKNHLLGHENNYDKRSHIFFPNWMIGRTVWQWLLKNTYVAITGGYNHTFGLFKRRDLELGGFFYGSQWWCLTRRTMLWLLDYCERHPEYEKKFQTYLCPDESFFHTLVMNSPYADYRKDYLHYIDWTEGKNSPKILTIQDLPIVRSSGKFFARKVDRSVDQELITALEQAM